MQDTLFQEMMADPEENFLINNNDFQDFERKIWENLQNTLTESESSDYN